jgi:hypothetical protein
MKSHLGTIIFKVPLIVISVIVLCLGTSIVLTDPAPSPLPVRTRDLLASVSDQWSTWLKAAPTNTAARSVPEEPGPRFSDMLFDDSGYQLALRFSRPLTDSATLAEIRDSVVGRGRRGIAQLEKKLAGLPASDAATPSVKTDLNMLIGALWMYEGEWAKASEHFAIAQTCDPSRPAVFRANLDALRGVVALRRGEIENCVACCNESSCIFPLAEAAWHQRTSGSREAIEHFTH